MFLRHSVYMPHRARVQCSNKQICFAAEAYKILLLVAFSVMFVIENNPAKSVS